MIVLGVFPMPLARKFLWIVNMNTEKAEQSFAKHAMAINATGVGIRTSSTRLVDAMGRFKALGMTVYAWRWPGVIPGKTSTHYYALDEADYVATQLIPKGLDGYIVDPESDGYIDKKTGKKKANDWDQKQLAPIARQFCKTIKDAAKGKKFVFGTTSGCAYPGPKGKPNIPWTEFFAASDVLLPQSYWRWTHTDEKTGKDVVSDINGGTPAKAIARGMAAWQPKANGKKILPMAGEVDVITPTEISAYGAELAALGVSEGHFYTDNGNIPLLNLGAMKAL
jgi:hypothetical protein